MKKQHEDEDVPIGLLLYLELCKRMYERMERDNSWPWERDPELNAFLEERIKEKEKTTSKRSRL